ncbi:hypothetical protein AWM79_06755 [Pseudomonas agarici]|uniref:Uncharacterized protein n=1 Tax=Pseudomonas agarici TaxID=46677 RepID=A0A0X1SYX4_PSEAA|nr:hypothetical protein [Pseudomonas agarici]AMB85025.1 hypothetical protein AWM79_06755 [Pseudomonas agarici]NWB93270.1 hypothetical protein [Pseudomonas agarici]NWC08357.1 hypothetical protein [Pseudomonas agarici]SEK64620.1 hypothetical protein SAMN05216604_10530 [Pseudomonas agarici]
MLEWVERELIDPSAITHPLFEHLHGQVMIAIDDFGTKLELGIAGAGAQTAEQRDYLTSHGIDFLQG